MITYIIQMDGPEPLVKFGRTKNPKARLASLATGVPWGLRTICYIGADCERDLKRLFKADHIRGEWYRPSQALMHWVRQAAADGRLVKQVDVDAAYINAVIKPRIREYLAGREPENNAGGDLVRCIFADLLPALHGREVALQNATKGHVSLTLAKGFGPTADHGELIIPSIDGVAGQSRTGRAA